MVDYSNYDDIELVVNKVVFNGPPTCYDNVYNYTVDFSTSFSFDNCYVTKEKLVSQVEAIERVERICDTFFCNHSRVLKNFVNNNNTWSIEYEWKEKTLEKSTRSGKLY